ncbi:PREDICTED: syntaxin-17 [Chrysochloris asiatica]|uniref:Syntaxin-17 n=1 Tax=Chrysochloris asiatica TaxID=185453 RepID=A0A9B0TLN0_CHRAS|nr:PREDICTED: syntaxin-17 [Chrysochloris asiatica]
MLLRSKDVENFEHDIWKDQSSQEVPLATKKVKCFYKTFPKQNGKNKEAVDPNGVNAPAAFLPFLSPRIPAYQRCRIWDKLHEEHINAGRTVQQLRSNIREMETLCLKVRKDDLLVLKRMIDPVKEAAAAATTEFLQVHLESVEDLKKQFNDEETVLPPSLTRSMTVGGTFHSSEAEAGPQSLTQIYALPEIPRDQNAAESWENLEADLVELSQLVTEFSLLVNSQQEKIDSIEDHVNNAAVNVEEGTKNLGKAAKYKLAALPVAGALIGGVVGGPIGLLAGFKVAGIAAALGGGVLGFTGGKLIQRKKQKMMEKLTSSCPDLPSQTEKKCS